MLGLSTFDPVVAGTAPNKAMTTPHAEAIKTPAKTKRTRRQRPFPASSFEEALELANGIQKYSSGQPIRRLTLFDQLGKSPESGLSRQLITNSGEYGLTKGGYSAEQLELTPEGRKATDPDIPERERARARIELAIKGIPPFKTLYERFCGNKLPSKSVLVDAIKEFDVPDEFAEEAVDTFIVNLQFVGLLQTISGADRILSSEHYLDNLPIGSGKEAHMSKEGPGLKQRTDLITEETATFERICFYVTASAKRAPRSENILTYSWAL
jgi:hypothetical protein